MIISVINMSAGAVSDGALIRAIRAINRQIAEDFAPFWSFGAQRKPGVAKVRVYNPRPDEHGWISHHTIIEMVNDDMPFLVDSLTAALHRRDLTVHLVIHPILQVKRDKAGNRRRRQGEDCVGQHRWKTAEGVGGPARVAAPLHITRPTARPNRAALRSAWWSRP